ncbi:HAD family hydrolase [Sphaerochaeta sp.]|uniref:HAD family hydrolase n=1 Tax=Sphaerochaeta sp. TaxID=1972642 RepID=UPI002FC6D817
MRTDRALIFDFNGTLFWDTLYHRQAWGAMSLRLRGVVLSEAESHYLDGRTNQQTLAYLLGREIPEDEVVQLSNEKELLYESICLSHRPLALANGAEYLIKKAEQAGRAVAIATSAGPDNIERYKKWFNLSDLVPDSLIIHDNGMRRGKPFPDLYLDACSALGCVPATCTVFEDTKAGILAAQAAGMGCIYAMKSPGSDIQTLQAMEGIHGLLDDFTQFTLDQ